MKDIMIDLETMATGSNSAIVQIGAVLFDRNARNSTPDPISGYFKCNVSLQSCIERGLRVDGDTVMWWMDKPHEQRQGLLKNAYVLPVALSKFQDWLYNTAHLQGITVQDFCLWGRSPRFDIGILTDAFRASGMKTPWDMRKEMCVRTIEALAPEVKKQHDENNKQSYQHDSISDCLHQIAYVSEIWQMIDRGFKNTALVNTPLDK